MQIQLDMYQTLAASVLVLMLGGYLKQKTTRIRKVLYSGTGGRRNFVCDRNMYLLQYRNHGNII